MTKTHGPASRPRICMCAQNPFVTYTAKTRFLLPCQLCRGPSFSMQNMGLLVEQPRNV